MLTVCRRRKHTVNFSLNHKGMNLTVSGKMAKFSTINRNTETLSWVEQVDCVATQPKSFDALLGDWYQL